METYVPYIILPTESVNAIYVQSYISRKRLEALDSAFETLKREFRYYKWKCQHPILSRIPFIKGYIRKKIGL